METAKEIIEQNLKEEIEYFELCLSTRFDSVSFIQDREKAYKSMFIMIQNIRDFRRVLEFLNIENE